MAEDTKIKVWDRPVRIFHWSLAIIFFVAILSGDDDNKIHKIHFLLGYAALALVVFRIIYGFFGTKHARFTDFIYTPAATWRYAKSFVSSKPLHFIGHNPLGGWMVVALLLALTVIGWSGLELYGEKGHGPLAVETSVIARAMADDDIAPAISTSDGPKKKRVKTEAEKFWKEVHEVSAGLTIFLVGLHVIGTLVASRRHKENLVKGMITGYKNRPRH